MLVFWFSLKWKSVLWISDTDSVVYVWIFRIGVANERERVGRRREPPALIRNPWVGAQVASPQSLILRPGRGLFYSMANGHATARVLAASLAVLRRSRASSNLRSRAAKISASRPASLSADAM